MKKRLHYILRGKCWKLLVTLVEFRCSKAEEKGVIDRPESNSLNSIPVYFITAI